MNAADLRRLYAYTDWANDRILGAIAGLSDEQFTREIVSSFNSIRDTVSHIAFAEWLWLQRWKGTSPSELPDWSKDASFEQLRDQMNDTAADRRAYLDDLADDDLSSMLSYRTIKGDPFTMPLDGVLLHCANHSTYHRGQLVTMIRQAGGTPPNTDYVQFLRV